MTKRISSYTDKVLFAGTVARVLESDPSTLRQWRDRGLYLGSAEREPGADRASTRYRYSAEDVCLLYLAKRLVPIFGIEKMVSIVGWRTIAETVGSIVASGRDSDEPSFLCVVGNLSDDQPPTTIDMVVVPLSKLVTGAASLFTYRDELTDELIPTNFSLVLNLSEIYGEALNKLLARMALEFGQ